MSDPTSPLLAEQVPLPGLAFNVAVRGDEAFLAVGQVGCIVLDVSDPSHLGILGTFATPGTSFGIAVAGEHAFLTNINSGLETLRVQQAEVIPENNVGQSLDLPVGTEAIRRTRLTSTQNAGVSWELSVDAGTSWMPIAADGSWTQIPEPGDGLQWRSTHTWSPGNNPTVSDLALDWLTQSGPITSVSDVPEDQGGWVRITFDRSGYDFGDEADSPVTWYQVYRRIDDATRRAQILTSGAIPSPSAVAGTPLESFDPGFLRIVGDQVYLVADATDAEGRQGTFPPGTWEVVATVLAAQQETYTVPVPTLADSTAEGGISWSVHFVTTHTTTPSIWFASQPDSGYSVDNIAPGVPQHLVFESAGILRWDAASEGDFQYHTIYGSESPVFNDSAVRIDYSVQPTYDVSGTNFAWYHVTTSDHAGNEGLAATIASGVADAPTGSLPTAFLFAAPRPNPVLDGTRLHYALPRPVHVALTVHDVGGRLVRTVQSGVQSAGTYALEWDGRGSDGRRASPGVYFLRLQAGSFSAERRVTMLR
ncbi:MAG: FlgD immunoglobulin-like domain containing protein [Candidatus Eisenbacteria bacterium]